MIFRKGIMRLFFITFSPLWLASVCFAQADDAERPRYVAEAPLPKGWPQPGPYDVVTLKSFPAYRAAYTEGRATGFAFWRLFSHIKRQGIPMTSPVEMGMGKKGANLNMKSMGFLYQHDEVGDLGKDGKKVEVRDVPVMKALSYTWQGDNSGANRRKAKVALDKALNKGELKSSDYRLMGYNGPRTPDKKKTWEMLLVLPEAGKAQP